MKHQLPDLLVSAIDRGVWRNVSPDVFRRILGDDLPGMTIFENLAQMQHVGRILASPVFMDIPAFCLVPDSAALLSREDSRLVVDTALFVAGNTIPGDDVFVAIDLGRNEEDPHLLVLDWSRAEPDRWVARARLRTLIDAMGEEGKKGTPQRNVDGA